MALIACAAGRYQAEADRLAQLMGWHAGEVIAEVGAGAGEMAFAAVQRVGPTGHVYLTELNASKVRDLQREVQKLGLTNASVLQAGAAETNLPDGCCDAIYLRRVYHHLLRPVSIDRSLFRALKPGGLVAVIDFPPSSFLSPVMGLPASHGSDHGIRKPLLEEELRHAGFAITNEPPTWPDTSFGQYCVIAQKPVH